MNIAGVIVHSHPTKLQSVKGRLVTLPGVEIHAETDDGRLVVTVEEDESSVMADTVMKFYSVEGVLSAAMIYHHCECDDPSEQEASK